MSLLNQDDATKVDFVNPTSLRENEQICQGNIQESSNDIIRSESKEKSNLYPKKYHCNECGKQLSTVIDLNKHKKAFNERITYPCGLCQYQFTSKGSLARHNKAVPEGIKYPCKQCQHQSTLKGNLAVHEKAVHEGISYPCEQCEHQFT